MQSKANVLSSRTVHCTISTFFNQSNKCLLSRPTQSIRPTRITDVDSSSFKFDWWLIVEMSDWTPTNPKTRLDEKASVNDILLASWHDWGVLVATSKLSDSNGLRMETIAVLPSNTRATFFTSDGKNFGTSKACTRYQNYLLKAWTQHCQHLCRLLKPLDFLKSLQNLDW